MHCASEAHTTTEKSCACVKLWTSISCIQISVLCLKFIFFHNTNSAKRTKNFEEMIFVLNCDTIKGNESHVGNIQF